VQLPCCLIECQEYPEALKILHLLATNRRGGLDEAPCRGICPGDKAHLGVGLPFGGGQILGEVGPRVLAEEGRSRYDPVSMTIIINLDHPLVAGALEKGKGNVEDAVFARISYEIAFTEYAMALGYEKAAEDPGIDADDLLYDVRDTINRLSRVSAEAFG
jgi:hypothetical protein